MSMQPIPAEASGVILDFISNHLLSDPKAELASDDDLLASDLLDSLSVVRLVDFVETTFEISVPPADVTIEHFMTVDTIVKYLASRANDDARSDSA